MPLRKFFHALKITFREFFWTFVSTGIVENLFIIMNKYAAEIYNVLFELLKIMPLSCYRATSGQIYASFTFFMPVNILHHENNTRIPRLYHTQLTDIYIP